jgi:exodeoxyribonuclease V alpha subunit
VTGHLPINVTPAAPAPTLTDEQQAAVEMVLSGKHRVCALTGGPGTGKSTTIREVVRRLRERGQSVALAAPSGKAALRLQEAAGCASSTIHRMLFLRPGSREPQPLTTEVVIVDEFSMCDVKLAAALMRAAFEQGLVRTLLLVGDADQLPPVGPGQPYLDLLASGVVPTVRLTQIQRQAAESGIVRAAHAIKAGRAPEWAPDFHLVEEPDPAAIPGLVQSLCEVDELDPEHTLILAPQRTGSAGVNALNEHLEAARGEKPALVRGQFRPGSRVIQTKNNYDYGVFNGELGWVVSAQAGPGKNRGQDRVVVEWTGRGQCEYRGGELGQLAPAWALTTHRAQGSEAKTVIFVASKQASYMLTRSLLYVAVTRARERVTVVGDSAAVEKAVRVVRDTRRTTMLRRWFEQARAGHGDAA